MLCNVTLPSCCHIFHLNIYLDIVYVFVSWPGLLFHILCVYSLMVGGQLVIHLLSKSWISEWSLILSFFFFFGKLHEFPTQLDFAVIAFLSSCWLYKITSQCFMFNMVFFHMKCGAVLFVYFKVIRMIFFGFIIFVPLFYLYLHFKIETFNPFILQNL